MELTEERQSHIETHHFDLAPRLDRFVALTLANPDSVRTQARGEPARIFAAAYDELQGKNVVVVVVSDPGRDWIVTAYTARKLSTGEIEWERTS